MRAYGIDYRLRRQSSIIAFAVAVLLCLVLAVLYVRLAERSASADRRLQRTALAAVRNVTQRLEGMLAQVHDVLDTLATQPDSARIDVHAASRGSQQPGTFPPLVHTIHVVPRDDSAAGPADAASRPAPLSAAARGALQTGAVTFDGVEPLHDGSAGVAFRFVRAVGLPGADGRWQALAVLRVRIDSLCLVPCGTSLSPGSVITITGYDGTVLYRTLNTREWVGKRVYPDTGMVLHPALRERWHPSWYSADGNFRAVATRTVTGQPWLVYVGMPSNSVDDEIHGSLVKDMSATTVTLLGALLILLLFQLRGVRRIETLSAAVASDLPVATAATHRHTPRNELDVLSGAYEGMRTQLAQRDDALKEAYARMFEVQKFETLGSFSLAVAHDFRHYLQAITLHAELIQSDLPDDTPQSSDLRALLMAATRASQLTDSILNFGRRSGPAVGVSEVTGVLRDISPLVARLVTPNQTVHIEGLPQPVWAAIDAGALEQVLMNLCANARDALQDTGSITVSVQLEDADTGRGTVCLRVADTGSGIDLEALPHVFEPFFTTKDKSKGTGLGLAVCRGIIDRIGGTITIESSSAAGTVVAVRLPQHHPATLTDSAPQAVVPTRSRTAMTSAAILLVVADPDVRALKHRLLTDDGFRVESVADAHAALSYLAHAPDVGLLITDVVMPHISGAAFLAAVHSLLPDLPVVFLCGAGQEGALREMPGHDSAPVIGNPCCHHELLAVVRREASRWSN